MRLATLEVNRTTPTPDPSPQGGGERTQRAAPFCVNPNGTRASRVVADNDSLLPIHYSPT
jgi:hypothetical protein